MPTPLLWAAVAAFNLALPADPTAKPAPALLVELAAPATLPLQGPVSRSRTIALRTELLADAAAQGGALTLEPFPGERYELRDVTAEAAYGDGVVYNAQMLDASGTRHGEATISVVGESVAATLRFDHALMSIEPAGAGLHRVIQLDESSMPTCATTGAQHVVPALPQTPQGGQGTTKAATNLPTIDVLVAYTPQAKNGQGGTNAIVAKANLAVTETNQGYQNSGVNQRMRLVHTAEMVGYTETGNFSTELNRLTNVADGHMDIVHSLRNQYGADGVCLLVNGSQYCGIAWLMGSPTNGFATKAFNVVARTCATGYYSFGHEFGHNFGSHHDKANAGGSPSYPYSYGWRTGNGAWRTIMAYAPGTRIKYWSNPSTVYNGQVLGLANQAENWKSLNNTAATTSQWRCSVPQSYCTTKVTSSFKVPFISHSGKPVSNGTGNFQVLITGAEPNNFAIVFWGLGTNNTPFMGGTLCVAPPITRLGAQVLDAGGNASFPFPITQFTPGDEVYAQGWFRDPPHPDGTGVGLTDGLRIDVCKYNQ